MHGKGDFVTQPFFYYDSLLVVQLSAEPAENTARPEQAPLCVDAQVPRYIPEVR